MTSPLATTEEVAETLGVHVKTVRRALVEHDVYDQLSPEGRAGKIPCLRIGGWSRVPRWWLDRAAAALKPTPKKDAP